MQRSWKATLKNKFPPGVLNTMLLRFPFLYRTKLVFYETNFLGSGEIDELLAQVGTVLDIEGDIIECGSSRCGTSVIMANYLRSRHVSKKILACDSFEGFDRAELNRERKAGLTSAPSDSFTSTSYEYVKKKIAVLGLQEQVIPIKGYFQDVLPNITGPFCLALIDCDLKDSLIYSAETIWPHLSSGGRILFDDYLHPDFKGAKLGVDNFVDKHRAEISEHGLLSCLYYVCKL